ncbi:MAG: M56 family metallopeptidase [Muribaculaceae bacterium]|nr:M56 family metallopeptidase [Muribaculaceae bacterium]
MGELLSYSIACGLVMLAMYLAYTACLARYNQHTFNRGVLMIIYAVAFAGTPALMAILGRHTPATYPAVSVAEIQNAVSAGAPIAKPLWGTVLIWIYMLGMAAVALKTLSTWLRLIKVIRSGEKIMRDGFVLVLTDDERYAPFSWLHYAVISRSDYTHHSTAILTHELKHIASGHWVDLLIAQAVCIVNWFNPAAWLMRDELMLVHEYQADRAVMDRGLDAREYQMLLIKKAVGARFPSLANSLNHSKLKKRITMMYKEKSGAGRRLNALALVPVLALALAVASVPAVRAVVSTIGNSPVTVDKVNENPTSDKKAIQHYQVTDVVHDGNSTTVVIATEGLGSRVTVSGGTFTNAGKIYQASSLQTQMTDGAATIKVTFPFAGELKQAGMTITVNGDEIPFNLEGYIDKSQQASSSPASLFSITGNRADDGIAIYINGEPATEEQVKNLKTTDIAEMTVSKEKDAILITTRK